MNFSFLHKLSSPRYFYYFSITYNPWIFYISLLGISISLTWGLAFTAPDYLQGNSYRIIFMHVPVASLALSTYMAMAIAGTMGYIWRIKLAFLASKSLAIIGFSWCTLALISGAIWGKPTWGTWWVWDARLTSMFILAFLYLGQIILRYTIQNTETAHRACALLGIVGLVNLPIIKYSVEWWNTLHQGASITLTSTSIAPEMLHPLLCAIASFYLITVSLFFYYMQCEILKTEYQTTWAYKVLASKNTMTPISH
ncbi:MAG: cytochrome c biogenesis protein CcsA [Endozoicomonadaceae bacterium]|nr:cytochrome c biogenesis protein CcsA [Endozoicomonadaceae bacterium]